MRKIRVTGIHGGIVLHRSPIQSLDPVCDLAMELCEQLDRGVFPFNRNKAPLTDHGFKDATTDPDRLVRLLSKSGTAPDAYAHFDAESR